MKIFERLKILRTEHNLTQVEVANAIHISDRAYRSLESGVSKPNVDTLINLSGLYNVSLDYLVCLSDIPEIQSKREADKS